MELILLRPGLQSPATVLLTRPIRGLMLKINRVPVNYSYNEDDKSALLIYQGKMTKENDASHIPVGLMAQ